MPTDSYTIYTLDNLLWTLGFVAGTILIWYNNARDYKVNRIIANDFPGEKYLILFYGSSMFYFIAKILFLFSIGLFIFSLYAYNRIVSLEILYERNYIDFSYALYDDFVNYATYSFNISVYLFSLMLITLLWDKNIERKLGNAIMQNYYSNNSKIL